jgi:hypothetical protein
MSRIRVVFPLMLCLAAAGSTTCIGQTKPATFKTQTYAERLSKSPYAVDVNNDGVLDLVQFLPQTAANPYAITFTVRVADGNGSFRNPVVYSFSTAVQYPDAWPAFGDFNGDGKVDVAFAANGGNQLTQFLGNGDGTFQGPRKITVALPSGRQFGSMLATADFNGDGKLDLVANTLTGAPTYSDSIGSIYLIPGNGTGTFGNPILLDMLPADHYVGDNNLVTGDFDANGKADIAFLEDYGCDRGNCAHTLHVLYNNGNSSFTDTSFVSAPIGSQFSFSAGDLNSDGRTDIFGSIVADGGEDQLELLYGQPDRTFHTYGVTVPTLNGGLLVMADLNGDTRMDLVGVPTFAVPGDQIIFFLADPGEGTFTQQAGALPTTGGANGLAVGDFNSDTRPDVLAIVERTVTSSTIAYLLNTTSDGTWGGCAYPHSGQGIHVCAPVGSFASPVTFNASANSFGQLRKMELWIDGKKAGEQHHTWGPRAYFNLSATLAPGRHRGVFFAADVDNRLQETVFYFNVGSCTAPSSPGVRICSPTSGLSVNSPVQVQAASTVTGTISRMELWLDGAKKYTTAGSSLSTSVNLAAGKHRFAVLAINTAGTVLEQAVDATVK